MKALVLFALIGALLAGCDTTGYYSHSASGRIAAGAIVCRIPKTGPWDQFYVTTNTIEACKSVGGVIVK
jgi:hypothetical protein